MTYINRLIKYCGLTQSDVARRLGIGRTKCCQMMSGIDKSITIAQAEELAATLKVSMNEILCAFPGGDASKGAKPE